MKLTEFKVTNFRNICDSGWIKIGNITAFVGQNEAGKSNLFEALYRINPFTAGDDYKIDEDWPVDDWENKDPSAIVCQAKFALTPEEIESLYHEAAHSQPAPTPEDEQVDGEEPAAAEDGTAAELPPEVILLGSRSYNAGPTFAVQGEVAEELDAAKVNAWARKHAPKFVLIQDYGLSGTQIELNQLAERYKKVDTSNYPEFPASWLRRGAYGA